MANDLFIEARRIGLRADGLIQHSSPRFHDPINRAVDIVDEALKYAQRAAEHGHDAEEVGALQHELADLRARLVEGMDQ